MRRLLFVLLLLYPAVVVAQPAPVVATTIRSTDTSATSLCVGGASGCASATGGIKAGAVDVVSVTSAGFIGIASNVPASQTYRLVNNAGSLQWNGVALATGASLSGTLNTIPVFTGASSVGNSIITQNVGATIITVTGTLTATTALGGTLTTASQPNVTTAAGLTSAAALATVGTVTTGVWNGTLIDLTRGGTGANLSGTGGTSNFLRQNTVGGAVTVVRPAVSDLSDGSNVPLLNAANTFTGGLQTLQRTTDGTVLDVQNTTALFSGTAQTLTISRAATSGYVFQNFTANGVSQFSVGGSGNVTAAGLLTVSGAGQVLTLQAATTGAQFVQLKNSNAAGVAVEAGINIYGDTGNGGTGSLRALSSSFTSTGALTANAFHVIGSSAGGLTLAATDAAGTIGLWTVATKRFAVDASGNWLKGSNIMDSTGTPTIGSGFGTGASILAGSDYGFRVDIGSTASTSGVILFGRSFSNGVVCTSSPAAAGPGAVQVSTLTTQVTLTYASTTGGQIQVLCRGY